MSQLALSASFDYSCYEYTAIINTLILSFRGPSLDVHTSQILMSKVGPCILANKVKSTAAV